MKLITIIAALAFLLTGSAYTQEKKDQTVTDKATKSRGKSDVKDPNIKSDSDTNKANANAPAPPNKGGTARGAACTIHIDNRTPYYIRIYVDGDYKGQVGPWGDGITYAIAGPTRLYGKALFDDGTSSSWGPRIAECYGSYTWILNK